MLMLLFAVIYTLIFAVGLGGWLARKHLALWKAEETFAWKPHLKRGLFLLVVFYGPVGALLMFNNMFG